MSYAIRNTLILLVTLLIMIGGAWAFLTFIQGARIDELEVSKQEKNRDLVQKQAIEADFTELLDRYQDALARIENYDKSLFPDDNPDNVFAYLTELNDGNSRLLFDFTYSDSTINDQYGAIVTNLDGSGDFSSFVNFINKLENSQLINKVSELDLSFGSNATNNDQVVDDIYSEVTFSFKIESLYERIAVLDSLNTTNVIRYNPNLSKHNPFYPLIRLTFPDNDENLPVIESSRITALTSERVFIIDQTGKLVTLREGDKVYLGFLESIDNETKSAKFKLDKAGIIEYVTLEVN